MTRNEKKQSLAVESVRLWYRIDSDGFSGRYFRHIPNEININDP